MGGMSGFTMIQSNKYNRSIMLDRKKMGQNPYALKNSPNIKRNPKEYKDMIQHRFGRQHQSKMITRYIYVGVTLSILLVMLYSILFT